MGSIEIIIYNVDDFARENEKIVFFKRDYWVISQHIESIYKDGTLERSRTNKKFLLVRTEGTRQVKRNIGHYSIIV